MQGVPWSRQMFSTMFIMNEVFPIDGRAATTNISPAFSPPDFWSSTSKPVLMPSETFSFESSIWKFRITSSTVCFSVAAWATSALSRIARMDCSTESSSSGTSSGAS